MAHLPAFYVISLVSEKALILYHNKPEKASRFCHFLRDSEPFDKLKHSMIQPLSLMNDPVVLAVALIAGRTGSTRSTPGGGGRSIDGFSGISSCFFPFYELFLRKVMISP
ncbi:hypothetical protein [uncultured Victivallis sp.]|uniref:hypothetical protein n=1 Tax=uncultured Victivallis sp. TaxID=354118 RepID=UPI0025E15B9F|nr:hypothetical protein [uncultured Victivallis sp.]